MSEIENREKEDDDRDQYKIRRNVAHISAQERTRFRNAILKLNENFYPDGVSYWFKQDQIHQASNVHGKPSFLTWHRELLNRYEALLQKIDPKVALHYWDWTTDPRNSPDGRGGFVNLFTSDFMGSSQGPIGAPFGGKLDNNGEVKGSRDENDPANPAAPPQLVTRAIRPGAASLISDADLISIDNNLPNDQQWPAFRDRIEDGVLHNRIHGWLGGSNAVGDTAFEDPFVYIFHANIDRLWAMWQTAAGYDWRLNAEQTYGNETNDPKIVEDLEPWAGKLPKNMQIRPWAAPDNQQYSKNSKHPSIILPPRYDTIHSHQSEENEEKREKENERG